MNYSVLDNALLILAAHAEVADRERNWPAASWEALRAGGVLSWSLPREYGGQELTVTELLDGYERLAGACLTSCFILSQREAACRRIRDGENEALRIELLPRLARGECFSTVGISQLTTSRQHGRPALLAREEGDNFILDGFMPWVTGAPATDYFVTGAVLETPPHEGKQILAVLPRTLPGVSVGEPLDLMALEGSLTAEVRCERVVLPRKWLLVGPAEKVLATNKGGAGGVETSCLAVGLAGAAIDYLRDEASRRTELATTADRLQRTREAIRGEVHRHAVEGGTPDSAAALRARANSLVLRATQAALTASKGAGFLRGHPAQRWVRQALFFLVWSCPRPATDAILAFLSCQQD